MFSRSAVSLWTVVVSYLSMTTTTTNALGSDYLDAVPPTFYEEEELSPRNMDFDRDNNMFVAHSGWYNDKEIHYYKFAVYAPPFYPDVITPGGSSAEVPVQTIYFVSTTGTFDGVVGTPVVEYHTSDGVLYSDFMAVTFVDAPDGYVADTYKSVADIMDDGATMTTTDIVLNSPIVPTDSFLQDPTTKGTNAAPIAPTTAYYRGLPVQMFVFEVTDQSAADYFADTRTEDTSVATARDADMTTTFTNNGGFGIPVVPFATSTFVSAIPLWHVNQFSTGVVEGENGGGPNPAGQRNVINLDRADAGYSPLWNLLWATEMPINYSADQFSNANQALSTNGFEFFVTPMYVNCPDIGPVGTMMNEMKLDTFETAIEINGPDESFTIIGSAPELILTPGIPVKFMANDDDNKVIGSTETNMLGGYEYTLMASDIPNGTTEIQVVAVTTSDDGEEMNNMIRTIPVTMGNDSSGVPALIAGGWAVMSMVVPLIFV